MPTTFSAATCITLNPGPQPATGPFDIYLNSDYDSTPFSSATLSQLTNCPFIIENVPSGTTSLGFKDIPTNYCITIPVQDNNLCTNCDLGLTDYSATSIGNITAGYLSGSCNPTDYQIIWYGPDNPTLFSFSSGYGIFGVNGISASTVNHPLTGSQAIPRVAGIYTPVITNVIAANGIHYSITGDSSTIPADLNCLQPINVLPITCDTNTNTDPNYPFSNYKHNIKLDVASTDLVDSQATFKITSSTKYLAWAFRGRIFADRITISFSGANYPDKIGLEDFVIGQCLDDLPICQTNVYNNFNPNIFPKSARTQTYFLKITTLTGFTINDYDEIIVDFKPSVPNTLWDFYMSCLDDWTCEDCYTNQDPIKIIGSSVSRTIQGCRVNVSFNVTLCDLDSRNNSEYMNYYGFNSNSTSNLSTNNPSPSYRISNVFTPSGLTCGTQVCSANLNPQCSLDSSSTYYDKTFLQDGRGVFGFTGSSTFISTYYEPWIARLSSCWSSPPPTNLLYYSYFRVYIPNQASTINCVSDSGGASYINLSFHPTSPISTGITTGSLYYMKITGNTINKQLTLVDPCENPDSAITTVVDNINITSTATTNNNYVTNRIFNAPGLYYQTPVTFLRLFTGTTAATISGTTTGTWTSPSSSFNTYPFSGTPSTIIPSLSGTVCNYGLYGAQSALLNGSITNTHYRYRYSIRLSNPSNNLNDFEVWATPVVNGQLIPPEVLAYSNIGGVITTNPTYVI
jgi:hypothetical protein